MENRTLSPLWYDGVFVYGEKGDSSCGVLSFLWLSHTVQLSCRVLVYLHSAPVQKEAFRDWCGGACLWSLHLGGRGSGVQGQLEPHETPSQNKTRKRISFLRKRCWKRKYTKPLYQSLATVLPWLNAFSFSGSLHFHTESHGVLWFWLLHPTPLRWAGAGWSQVGRCLKQER